MPLSKKKNYIVEEKKRTYFNFSPKASFIADGSDH